MEEKSEAAKNPEKLKKWRLGPTEIILLLAIIVGLVMLFGKDIQKYPHYECSALYGKGPVDCVPMPENLGNG